MLAVSLILIATSGSLIPNHVTPQQRSQSPEILEATPSSPVWPLTFNATLAKVNPSDDNIVWTKLYYDWTVPNGGAARFDFYNGYVDDSAKWSLNCSILFTNFSIWFVFPEEQVCNLRTADLPSINPAWVGKLNATFKGLRSFRGIEAQLWEMADPDDPSHIMRYYARHPDNSIPLRSPNQINDPGNTDFFDVMVGPQPSDYFKVPTFCENLSDLGCPR